MKDMQFAVRRTVVHNGAGAAAQLPFLLKHMGAKRCVLYTDAGLVKAGTAGRIIDLLNADPDVELAGVFDEIQQDATGSVINRGAAFFREKKADSMIALGGGSVMDTTKAIKWMVNNGTPSIYDAFVNGKKLEKWPDAQPIPIPHIALGTTAGTGCEITGTAVVFHEEKRVKISLMNEFIAPDRAIADPELLLSLPPHLTAYTGFDALTHAIEGYFSRNANPISDMYAKQAIEMISQNIVQAVRHGDDLEARNNMLVANILAIAAFGFAIGNTPVHNMSHMLGAKCRIPHGLANAVLLEPVMAALPDMYGPRIRSFGVLLGMKELPEAQDACYRAVLEALVRLSKDAGIPDNLEFDITEDNIGQYIEDVHNDPVGVNFRIPDEAIRKVLFGLVKR